MGIHPHTKQLTALGWPVGNIHLDGLRVAGARKPGVETCGLFNTINRKGTMHDATEMVKMRGRIPILIYLVNYDG